MANVSISGLTKSVGRVRVLKNIDLAIQAGEFCVVVGPAGSGKSMLLRTLAGLESADAGTITFDGEAVNDLMPRDRNVALVPQAPVLFPTLSVFENIAFGLRTKGLARAEIIKRVEEASTLVDLPERLSRSVRGLTAGECQKIALAQAIARDALLHLFDEPLSRLDGVRREPIRAALKQLHQEKEMTIVYVTQDHMEAMNLADRIVLLRDGAVEQQGTPIELFERPTSRFVAGFFGALKMNFLTGTIARDEAGPAVRLANGGMSVPLPPNRLPQNIADGTSVILGLRPEHMARAVRVSPPDGTMRYEAEIELLQPTGPRVCATFRMGGEPVVAELQAHDVSAPGETVAIDINLKRATLFDAETEKTLSPEYVASSDSAA